MSYDRLTFGSGLEFGLNIPVVVQTTMATEGDGPSHRRVWWRYDCYLKGVMPSNGGLAFSAMEERSIYHRYRVYYEAADRGGAWRVRGVFMLATPACFESARALVRQAWNWKHCCIEGDGVRQALESLEEDSLCNVTCDVVAMTSLLKWEGIHEWVVVGDDDDVSEFSLE